MAKAVRWTPKAIATYIEVLSKRSEVRIVAQQQSWLVVIPKGPDFVCEVTVPYEVLEWYANVKKRPDMQEVWSDWMDYTGYNDSPMEKLEAEMVDDLIAFIDRVSGSELVLPLTIWEKKV